MLDNLALAIRCLPVTQISHYLYLSHLWNSFDCQTSEAFNGSSKISATSVDAGVACLTADTVSVLVACSLNISPEKAIAIICIKMSRLTVY